MNCTTTSFFGRVRSIVNTMLAIDDSVPAWQSLARAVFAAITGAAKRYC